MENKTTKPELTFADLPPGRSFRPLKFPVTPDLVKEYMETVGDHHPLYFDEKLARKKSLKTPLAPPGLAAIYARLSYLQDYTMPSGGVLVKQEFEFHDPVYIGEILEIRAQVEESYQDEKGRKRVTFFIKGRNEEGKLVTTVRLSAIWPK